jgi:hypothetical protein
MPIPRHETTLIHRLDDRQFHELLHVLIHLLKDDPAEIAALTQRLKESAGALTSVVETNKPK